ncbi:MAG: hypothetical protein DRN88_00715, partial [Candidatus Hydrothermarchaeota archaeon]
EKTKEGKKKRSLEKIETSGGKKFVVKKTKRKEKRAIENLKATKIKNSSIEKLKILTKFISDRKY